jgi:hypothetical protein
MDYSPNHLFTGKAGPGKGWLGLPVSLYINDPFEFQDSDSLESVWLSTYYYVVFLNFTTGGLVR